jgi:hypothetical protein
MKPALWSLQKLIIGKEGIVVKMDAGIVPMDSKKL